MVTGIPRTIDSHCHITHRVFDADREQILAECSKRHLLLVNSALDETEAKFSFHLSEKGVLTSVGFDPKILSREEAQKITDFILTYERKMVAIGEVGLDWFWVREHSRREEQERIFLQFVHLADRLGKPLVVHSRSAGVRCGELLLSLGFKRVLMHAYDGSVQRAVDFASKGFLFSIPPSSIRSEHKRKLVKALPVDALLLESDAPALGPVQGERNLPTNVFVSADFIRSVKGVELEHVLRETYSNSAKFFGLE
jgi:TatD DNase family protein